MSRFDQSATQILTRTDGGKLAPVCGQKSSSFRSSCSTSFCTHCHSDIAGGLPQRPLGGYISAPLVGSERYTRYERATQKRGSPHWGLPQSSHVPPWRTRHALRSTGRGHALRGPDRCSGIVVGCVRRSGACSRVLLKAIIIIGNRAAGALAPSPSDFRAILEDLQPITRAGH